MSSGGTDGSGAGRHSVLVAFVSGGDGGGGGTYNAGGCVGTQTGEFGEFGAEVGWHSSWGATPNEVLGVDATAVTAMATLGLARTRGGLLLGCDGTAMATVSLACGGATAALTSGNRWDRFSIHYSFC